MVAAATQLADNPARLAAEAAHLPPRLAALICGKIDLPVKLMFHPRLFSGGAASSEEALFLGEAGRPARYSSALGPELGGFASSSVPDMGAAGTDAPLPLYLVPLGAGLGDMALPAMLVALLLSHDVRRATAQHPKGEALPGAEDGSGGALRPLLGSWRFWRGSFALPALAGYAAGMLCTMCIAMSTDAAQPALLYLAPGTLLAVLARSRRSGAAERSLLWWGEDPPDPAADKQLSV